MTNDKLIGSFYRIYKELHKKLEESIIDDGNEYIAARVLDKLIVFYFIKENLMDSSEKNNIDEMIKNSSLKYEDILEFYKNPLVFFKETSNIILSITNLFNNEILYECYTVEPNIINECFKKLSKFEWSFKFNGKDVITPDLLGNVFEKYINQKDTGAYYTDIDTIKYINRNSIVYAFMNGEDIVNILNNTKYKQFSCEERIEENKNLIIELKVYIDSINNIDILNKFKQSLDTFKVADITVGTGAFLLDAIDVLEELYSIINNRLIFLGVDINDDRINLLIKIIENNIYGVDIMEDAIEMAKFRILLKVINISINENSYIKRDIKINLKTGNTLVGKVRKNDMDNLVDDTKYDKKFDWYEMFPEVTETGGFNCIIGNPPYIEYSKVMKLYKVHNFESIKCGNVYAFVIERAIDLLRKDGVLGLIVPISLVSTQRMQPIRGLLERECGVLFYSNYGDRPGTLFNGVHQKLTIIIAKKNKSLDSKIYTSQYYHWYKEERNEVFNKIRYVKNDYRDNRFYYKIGNTLQKDVINKINNVQKALSEMIKKVDTEYDVYLSTRLTFWVKSFLNNKESNEFKRFCFSSKEEALIFNAIMNSSLYYYWWETVSDCWHLTNKELELFKFDFTLLTEDQKKKLVDLSYKLEESLENNKKYIGSKQTEYEYKHKMSKCILDKIDLILADYYGLSEEEYQNIIDYNLSYRMNDELENYLKIRTRGQVEER